MILYHAKINMSNANFNLSTTIDDGFLDNFILITNEQRNNNNLKFYCPIIDANAFQYDSLINSLRDAAAHYCLSRRTWDEYQKRPMTISKLVRDKFRKIDKNKGELGELMLFSFLESDLKAPKILSKMELKTNPNMYVNGADGVHYLKLDTGDYQLIFGESKAYNDLFSGINNAIDSIYKFINTSIKDDESGTVKGIPFEKGLLNAHIVQEAFSEEERQFLKNLIYPKSSNSFYVDTAFAVFVLFNFDIPNEKTNLSNSDFREWIRNELQQLIGKKIDNIFQKLADKGLNRHTFYFYIVPFDKMEKNQSNVLEKAVE